MSLSNALKGRWNSEKFDKHGVALAARKHFYNALDARDTIEAKRALIGGDTDLSDAGRKKALATVATAEADRVAKAQRALVIARDKLREQRIALTPTVRDKANLADAALRQEVRAKLRDMKPGEIAALVNDANTETIVLEALFEGPGFLTGTDQATRDQYLAIAIERTAGPAVEALADQSEAVDLLAAACTGAAETLCIAAGITPYQYEKWIGEVAPADAAEREAEAATFTAEAVTQSAAGLPLAARMTLVDQLLATNTAEITKAP